MATKDIIGWWTRKPVKAFVALLAAAEPQPFPQGIERILVVREGGFGDILLTVPILRTLREFLGPHARLDVLVRRPVRGLLEDYREVNHVYAKGADPRRSRKTIAAMRRRRYQVVLDLVSSPSLSFALWILAAAPHAFRIGGDKAELRGMYHRHIDLPPRPSIHFMERLRRIAALAFGDRPLLDRIPWIAWPPNVIQRSDAIWQTIIGEPTQADNGKLVVLVNLSAGLPRRVWPEDSYRELLRRLVPRYEDHGHRWLLTAAPAEQAHAISIAAALNRPDVIALAPDPDFRIIAALVGRASLVITPDTSLVHAASAQGTPVVAFTVAENTIAWAPWKIPAEVVAAAPGQPVSTIPVEKVAAAFDRLVAAIPRATGFQPVPRRAPPGGWEESSGLHLFDSEQGYDRPGSP